MGGQEEAADVESTEEEEVKSDGQEEEVVSEDGGEDEKSSVTTKEGEEETEEVEEEPQLKVTVDDIKTAPMDYRFPTSNQAKHCYTRYNEFHKCAAEKGEDADACVKYARYYRSLCPGEWVDKWNEQREEGTFAGRY